MKTTVRVLILGIVCLCSSDLKAQFDSTLHAELRRLLIDLNRADCRAPFMYELAAHFTNDTFYTILSYDTSDARNWLNLYYEFNAMSYTPGYIPSDTLIEQEAEELVNTYNILSSTTVEVGKVPIGVMDFDYNSIRTDAFDSANNGRWYFWNNDSIWDNPFRADEPFESNHETPSMGTCLEIFAFSPLMASSQFRNVNFVIDPSKFIFYDNPTYSSNVQSHPSPHLFQIDFDDGGGWRTVDPFNYAEITILYPAAGTYYPKAQVVMDGVPIKHSLSTFTILTNEVMRLPDLSFDYPHVQVGIYKGCGDGGALKPIVYLSGIDILEDRHIPDIYDDVIRDAHKPELLVMLRNYDYDFVIVDWKDSKIDMRTNASAVVEVLDFLKTLSDSSQQFVVIGESMGGVIGRYALTYMETSTYFSTGSPSDKIHFRRWRSHNTRLFISYDAPHQGAIIPLGFQHATDWVYRVPRPLIRTLAFFYSAFKNSLDFERNVIKRDAVRQLLIFHRDTRNGSAEYTAHSMRDDFMTDLISLNPTTGGWPARCKRMAISNGLFDGSFQVGYKDSIVQPNDVLLNVNMFIGVKIFHVIPIPIFAMDDSKVRINPQGSGNIVELGWRYNLGTTITSVSSFPFGLVWSLRGCLTNVFKKKSSPCNILGVGLPFTVDINNADPWERYPGGTQDNLDRKSEKDNISHTMLLAQNIVDYDAFNGTYTIKKSIGARFMFTDNFTLNAWSQVPRFCFVPLQSALDYHGLDSVGNDLPQNFNIDAETILNNLNRTPFDIVMGFNRSVYYPGTRYFYPTDQGYMDNNGDHMELRNDPINEYNIAEPANHGILNREIGDVDLYLDNLTVTHDGIYQASSTLIAGRHENPYYRYPDISHPAAMDGLIADSGKFIVDSFTTPGLVEFRAGSQIILRPGFEAKYNTKFRAYIEEIFSCDFTLEQLQDMNAPPEPVPLQPDKVATITVDDRSFKVYPNPTFSTVTVTASNGTITNGFLTDMQGRQVGVGIPKDTNCNFNLENLAIGTYICVIECESAVYRFKIIRH